MSSEATGVEGAPLLVKRERDSQHFAPEDYCRSRRAEALGDLCLIVRLPQPRARRRACTVEDKTPQFGRSPFAEPTPPLFAAGVLGPWVEADRCDDGVA